MLMLMIALFPQVMSIYIVICTAQKPWQKVTKSLFAESLVSLRDGIRKSYKKHDVRHEKTDHKVFVVVMPKEGWAHVATPILLLTWHRLFENIIYDVSRVKLWKVGVIPKEGSFFCMTKTKTLRSVFLWHASYNMYKEVCWRMCSEDEQWDSVVFYKRTMASKWLGNLHIFIILSCTHKTRLK